MTFSESCEFVTVDELKVYYLTYWGQRPRVTRKAELVSALEKGFLDTEKLKSYWSGLPDLEKQLIQEALYNYDGRIDKVRFEAKYGRLPASVGSEYIWGYREKINGYRIFFYPSERYGSEKVPSFLAGQLKQFVQPPASESLNTSALPEPLPEECLLHSREQSVFTELNTLLTALQSKSLKISEKTRVPTAATLKHLSTSFHEYYDKTDVYGMKGEESILSYGWVRLLANSRFTTNAGTSLSVSKKLAKSTAETVKAIWDDWVKKSKDDEFNRIDIIKGQKGKGKRYFSNVSSRRTVIAGVLAQCEVNKWMSFKEFSRYIQITGTPLEVTSAPEYLYLFDANYGSLCGGEWAVIEESYLRCLLVEYAATLGMIDVVMFDLDQVEKTDVYHWGLDEIDCISRYDGLHYLRLTELGAYVLELSDNYQVKQKQSETTSLRVKRKGRIVFDATPQPWECQFIALYAKKIDETTWELNRKSITQTLQTGGSIEELSAFLHDREQQPFLPEDCELLLKQIKGHLDGVKVQGDAVILTCKNRGIFELIINDKILSKWCQPLSNFQLVVLKSKETTFKNKLNELGIGCL